MITVCLLNEFSDELMKMVSDKKSVVMYLHQFSYMRPEFISPNLITCGGKV